MRLRSGSGGWRRHAGAAALGLTLVLAACGGGESGGDSGASTDSLAAGRAEFREICSTCHGRNGGGRARLGKSLRQNEFVRANSDAELVEFIKVGRPAGHPLNEHGVDMPPKGGNPALTDRQIEHIVAYLRSLS